MTVSIKIAFRNIVLSKKRSILIGFAIFISAFLLNVSNAFMNGVEKQVLRGYKNLQSGDVAVVWSGLKEIKNNTPDRLFLTAGEQPSFDPGKNDENLKSIEELHQFINENSKDIKAFFPAVKRSARMYVGDEVDNLIVTGLTREHAARLLDSGALAIKEGQLYSDEEGVCISEENARLNKLNLGDTIIVEAVSMDGSINKLELTVEGIYKNGAGYDNYYGFMNDKGARNVFKYDEKHFDIAHIFMAEGKNSDSAIEAFADKLDKRLQSAGNVLRAESYMEASAFYTNNPKIYKITFNGFIIFLIVIIAIGLRATIRMNLFERMSEFGTLRAIGFSRAKCYAVIFNEVFILSLISLVISTAASTIVVLILGRIGIYAGAGAMSFAFGGESLYPVLKWEDSVFAVGVMVLLALFSTINPGLRLCYQKITDILAKKQKRIFPLFMIIKGICAKKAI